MSIGVHDVSFYHADVVTRMLSGAFVNALWIVMNVWQAATICRDVCRVMDEPNFDRGVRVFYTE